MRTLNLSREAQGTYQLSLPYQEEFIKTPLMFPNYINGDTVGLTGQIAMKGRIGM